MIKAIKKKLAKQKKHVVLAYSVDLVRMGR